MSTESNRFAKRKVVRGTPSNTPLLLEIDSNDVLVDTSKVAKIRRRSTRNPLQRRVTITDVAKACGVTPATVSRVLNNKKKSGASEVVRERIQEAARRMGYVPDLAARNLNRNSSQIIGLFASPYTHVAEGINESLLEGIADVLHAGGYDVFFELGAISRHRPALPFWRFDGAILLQAPKPETVTELDQRGVRYVCVNENKGNPIASILSDDQQGMKRAMEHLMMLGHRRFAYANAPSNNLPHYSVAERHRTLVDIVAASSLELVEGHDSGFAVGRDFLMRSVIEGGATAILTYDHNIAVTLVGAAHELNLQIPKDFSLICFNNVFPVAQLGPPLTVVSVAGYEMGRLGASLLVNFLEGNETHKFPGEVRVPEELVVRGSTAPPGLRG